MLDCESRDMSSSLISHPKGENKMDTIYGIANIAIGVVVFVLEGILILTAVVTLPIWIIPYLIIFRR